MATLGQQAHPALGSAITLSLGLTILAGIVPEPLVAVARTGSTVLHG